jgi:ABC-type branched-subunit amino acid transport system substrate-binding protein
LLAIEAAIADNNIDFSSPIILEFENKDTKHNITLATEAAEAIITSGAIGFVGLQSSTLALHLHNNVLLPSALPLVSGGALAASLSNDTKYPYLVRTYPSNAIEADAIVALLDRFAQEKQKVAIISRPSEENSVSLLEILVERYLDFKIFF